MHFFVGTSGYGYKEWKGHFYPEKMPASKMLGYYSERFESVELNGSFYRMPTAASLKSLAEQVPANFRFAVKSPQSITHFKRLKEAESDLEQLVSATAALEKHRGPVLFQLPPNFKKDLDRLEGFLKLLDKTMISTAFEFRHDTWYDDEVFSLLKKHSCALCAADAEDTPPAELVKTTDWGYVRLRRDTYTKKELTNWFKNIHSQGWKETFVFFKHEDTAEGTKLAARFLELVARA